MSRRPRSGQALVGEFVVRSVSHVVYGIRQSPYLEPNRIVRLRLVGGDALVGTASCLGLMMYSYSLRSLILLGLVWAAVLDGSEATAQLTEPPVRIEPAFAWSSAKPSDALASASDAATYVGEELFPAPGLSPDDGQGLAERGDLGFANDPTYGLGPTAWQWTVLPDGLIYRSYMAGVKESRIAGVVYGTGEGESIFDATLGDWQISQPQSGPPSRDALL